MWVLEHCDVRDETSGIGVWRKAMREVNMNPEASSPRERSDVDGSGFVHGNGFVILTRRWNAKEIEKHLHSNTGRGGAYICSKR